MSYSITLNSYEETLKFGEKLAKVLPNGTTILLYGDLGAGKTTIVRGIAQGLDISEKVQSPTFNIMKIYLKGKKPLVHIDAYRLADINTDIGLDEYIGIENGLTAIEWPMFIKDLLPHNAIKVTIDYLNETKRQINIEGLDKKVEEKL